jgi:hypothetical protein
MIYPTNHTKAALMLLSGTHGLLLQLCNVLAASDYPSTVAMLENLQDLSDCTSDVIANARDQLGSAASLLQANPDSAALCTLAATIPPMVASLEVFRIGFAGDSDLCDVSHSIAALYMLATDVMMLNRMLDDLTSSTEGQP